MSDFINWAAIETRLNRVIESTDQIERKVDWANNRLVGVTDELNGLNAELNQLRQSFNDFVDDSKRVTALQKAATELIRVRQELEQKFGGYKIVRETMLGVLQATDLALVKKTTISQISEELMLSTPNYWLAPCLIAVAAWIGNDRDLANRAIKEALKRNEEKTAITMALICRRNNRRDTCFEWLSLYFSHQDAENFTESNFTYLNAYLNGVFGIDEKHLCDDYVSKWLEQIQGAGEDFVQKQNDIWREYCKNFTANSDEYFPTMKGNVREYNVISEYVGRINSARSISTKFSDIMNVEIEDDELKQEIDENLIKLIARCDPEEEPLRNEEKFLQAVRYFNGDESRARYALQEADKRYTENTIDLVGQMTHTIISRKDATASERKTAGKLLSNYIRGGVRDYLSEMKPLFPQNITMQVDKWSGVSDGTNQDALLRDFEETMNKARVAELKNAGIDKLNTHKMLSSWWFWLVSVALCIFLVGFIGLIVAAYNLSKKNSIQASVERINADYRARIANGKNRIVAIIKEWDNARNIVSDFENKNDYDIVA